jgi:tRNA nucleotidyltransferase (CCA-adding enzyme)
MCLAALFSRFNPAESESVAGTLRLTGPLAAIARDTIVLRNSEPVVRAVADRPSALARALSGLNTEAVEAWAELTGDATVADALRRYLRELLNLKPALTGNDFLELGAVEGPMVGELLEILREARLDGLVSSDEEERTMARDLVAQKLAEDTE